MAIPETQLESWSHQGAVRQSRDTYGIIKDALDTASATYAGKDFAIFLQGSYGNDTNIYADSDVDVVVRLDETYYRDLKLLSEVENNAYLSAASSASYSLNQFKADVIAQLKGKYGSAVTSGKKAVFVQGNGSRRDADVMICAEFRRYYKFLSFSSQSYEKGICFFLPDGTRIENFPKQHSDNCTAKHQATRQWFKPMVRVLKNMRNRMIEEGLIEDGLAPSYFLEGLLYNVSEDKFGNTYSDTFVECFDWAVNTDVSKLVCANELHWLVRDGLHTSWPPANYSKFLDGARQLWNQWS